MPTIEILNPLGVRGWDRLVLEFPGCTIFHSAAWARVLAESYGYAPQYITLKKGGRLLAVLPVMEIQSFLTGRRGVSLPFSDLCPPLVQDPSFLEPLIEAAISHGKIRRWKHLDLRGANLPSRPFCSYYGHHLDLAPGERKLFSGLKSSHKRNIKKAENEGVAVSFFRSLESVRSFSRLNGMTRKKHGLPPQPFRFFRKLHEHLISKGKGIVALAAHRGKTVAGAVYLNFGKTAVYKYGASDPAWLHLRPNNLVMWESIRRYARKGFDLLDFGRTDLDHDGLLRFKRGWGGEETILHYHRFDMATSRFVESETGPKNSHTLMKKMPEPVLRGIGMMLYRHMG
ncbi:lipid II:glycine glycyltransferase FemX [Desulfococcus sp.]|uniref:lipid II:glycine glycyltransferase FemX n=1 Tax=Desulfococcus sp. TaxID=2025834 RepID=UPI0035932633